MFKVGQKVRVIDKQSTKCGREGTVVAVEAYDEDYEAYPPSAYEWGGCLEPDVSVDFGDDTAYPYTFYASKQLEVVLPAPLPQPWRGEAAEKAIGQKDDSGKLRTDLLPPKALRLIYEYVSSFRTGEEASDKENDPDCVLALLAQWRETGEVDNLAFAASEALNLCQLDIGKEPGMVLNPYGLEAVTRVLEYGAFKAPRPDGTKGYGVWNWEHVDSERYYAAAIRHVMSYVKSEFVDPESGLPAMAHVACNIMFLLHKEG